MRVLNVNHLLDPVSGGGTAERTLQLCKAFAAAGVECTVLTLDIGMDARRRAEFDGIRVITIPCLLRRFFVPRFSWHALKREVEAADVVHVMGHWTLLNALVFLAARSAGRPYVVTPAGALPIIGRSRLLKRFYNFLVGRRLVRQASGHIAITADEIAHFRDYGVATDRIAVVPNGAPTASNHPVDCDSFLARHGLKRGFVLFLGRLAYIKGPDLLLEAFGRIMSGIPDSDLVYAGPDDGMLPKLKEQASRRGMDKRVHFVGHVGGDDKACALQNCALLAIPSRQEAMSLVALEAAVHGKPVLLTDHCGFGEVEQAGGGRVAAVDAAALGDALAGMLADPAELQRMGSRLETFVKSRYAWDRAAARHVALFREATGKG